MSDEFGFDISVKNGKKMDGRVSSLRSHWGCGGGMKPIPKLQSSDVSYVYDVNRTSQTRGEHRVRKRFE